MLCFISNGSGKVKKLAKKDTSQIGQAKRVQYYCNNIVLKSPLTD